MDMAGRAVPLQEKQRRCRERASYYERRARHAIPAGEERLETLPLISSTGEKPLEQRADAFVPDTSAVAGCVRRFADTVLLHKHGLKNNCLFRLRTRLLAHQRLAITLQVPPTTCVKRCLRFLPISCGVQLSRVSKSRGSQAVSKIRQLAIVTCNSHQGISSTLPKATNMRILTRSLESCRGFSK